jgi:protein kinase-like protein
MSIDTYQQKYHKYKSKYLAERNKVSKLIGGGENDPEPVDVTADISIAANVGRNVDVCSLTSKCDDDKCVKQLNPDLFDFQRSKIQGIDYLGQGAFGAVYKITFEDGESYALKTVKLQTDKSKESFDTELNIQRKIRNSDGTCKHNNVNCYINTGENSDCGYIVMDLYDTDLSKFLSGRDIKNPNISGGTFKDLANSDVKYLYLYVDWVKQLISATRFFHGRDIAHMDIKPDNVLINTVSGDLVLADYDTLCYRGSTCQVMGKTPGYYYSGLDTMSDVATGKIKLDELDPFNKKREITLSQAQLSDWYAVTKIILEMWGGKCNYDDDKEVTECRNVDPQRSNIIKAMLNALATGDSAKVSELKDKVRAIHKDFESQFEGDVALLRSKYPDHPDVINNVQTVFHQVMWALAFLLKPDHIALPADSKEEVVKGIDKVYVNMVLNLNYANRLIMNSFE